MNSTQLKVYLTIAIVIIGGIITATIGVGKAASEYQSSGTAIDFGDWEVTWTNVDLNKNSNAKSVLEYACNFNAFELEFNSDGTVKRIKDYVSDENNSWELWVVRIGEMEWTKLSTPYNQDLSEYTVSTWAYRGEGEKPTIGVDFSGSSIYGYPQKARTVTLSPSLTEMMVAIGGVKTLVGTDKFSDYPEEVVRMQKASDIAIVGDYTTPSYEAILKTNPDAVFCDGSQFNHVQMADRLKKVNVCAILMYSGESIETIMDNIYIMGRVMGYDIGAQQRLIDLNYCMNELSDILEYSPLSNKVDTMISLSGDMSPWVSGSYTYASDILADMYGINVFSNMDGWVHINSEQIVNRNPSKIIILTEDWGATQEEYDTLMASLSHEWQGTDAYKNGEIYLICESAGEMAQRPGPRFAQFAELTARILNPDVFTDIEMPKYVGDNYTNYLTYTKLLG